MEELKLESIGARGVNFKALMLEKREGIAGAGG